jgi:hypothetical protein
MDPVAAKQQQQPTVSENLAACLNFESKRAKRGLPKTGDITVHKKVCKKEAKMSALNEAKRLQAIAEKASNDAKVLAARAEESLEVSSSDEDSNYELTDKRVKHYVKQMDLNICLKKQKTKKRGGGNLRLFPFFHGIGYPQHGISLLP